ncbi:MAG: serine hydrolase domain-containing protein [Oscillospiraceae bacterium]
MKTIIKETLFNTFQPFFKMSSKEETCSFLKTAKRKLRFDKRSLKRYAAALCACLMLTTVAIPSVSAMENTSQAALPSGITIDKLQLELNDIANQPEFDEPQFASAAVGVFQGDEVLYTGYFGKINMEDNIHADENSVYEWGSISKTLIWVSAMQLWEQGKLDLDRDVREYLPDGFFQHLSYDEPITMMNLMNHNAGWQETTFPIEVDDVNDVLPLGEALQQIEPAQIHRPGEVTAYSNYGAAVAGYVIECITGQDYCEYVHENIFEPLGMEHTALSPDHSDNEWVYEQRKKVKSYRFSLGHCIDLGNCLYYIPAYPAGAATGTLSDLITYAQALVNDEAPLFKDPETQEEMFSATDFYGSSDIPMCAHGFWCNEYAVRTYGHSGATAAGQANMIFDRDSKIGLVVLVNEPNGNDFLYDAPSLVFGTFSPDKYVSDTVKKAELNGYYLPARSTYRGMLKFIPYLIAIPAGNFGNVEDIGKGIYLAKNGEYATLLGSKTYPDGSTAICQPSVDLIYDGFYLVKLCLLTIYVLLAVAAIFTLLIRHKLKKHGKWTAYFGARVMTAGEMAKICSVLAFLGTYIVYASCEGGIPYIAGVIIGVLQIICIAVCAAAAIVSIAALIKEKNHTLRFIAGALCNILVIAAIVYFEMYRFW